MQTQMHTMHIAMIDLMIMYCTVIRFGKQKEHKRLGELKSHQDLMISGKEETYVEKDCPLAPVDLDSIQLIQELLPAQVKLQRIVN